jgi:hypothetical protein
MLLLGALMVAYYFVFHRPFVDVLITRLYVRLRFGVPASWEESKILRRLFCVDFRTLQWQPMKHVQSLPLEQRLFALLEAARG